MTQAHYPYKTAVYKPNRLLVEDGKIIGVDHTAGSVKETALHSVDALHHWFTDLDGKEWGEQELNPANIPRHIQIARMLTRDSYGDIYVPDVVQLHQEPNWTRFRDTATFISGEYLNGEAKQVADYFDMYNHGDTVILDGINFDSESAEGTEPPALNSLMWLAGNTKKYIEDALVKEFPTDTRRVIDFLNAAPGDSIYEDPADDYNTKWLIESRFLAYALAEIPGFAKNWNTLIIKNAMRYILSNTFNVNALYRLLAKLGRVNTRVIFLG